MIETQTGNLEEVAHQANDALFDVSSMLMCARSLLADQLGRSSEVERVMRVAELQIEQIQKSFGPYI
jgi:hypothetical protein